MAADTTSTAISANSAEIMARTAPMTQYRDDQQEPAQHAHTGVRPARWRKHVLDRAGAAPRESITHDDRVSYPLASTCGRRATMTITKGIKAVTALEASAIARSKPTIR